MTTKVLITHHHRDAIENAADRGFWMPLPLGDRRLLAGWLPRQREAVQIVELDALLAVRRLSDVLPGSGACCHLPRRAVRLAPVQELMAQDPAA